MSSTYRDDLMDSARLTELLLSVVGTQISESVRLADSLSYSLRVDFFDQAELTDEIYNGSTGYRVYDSAQMNDAVADQLYAVNNFADLVKLADSVRSVLSSYVEDSAALHGEISSAALTAFIADAAVMKDELSGQRISVNLMHDTLRMRDMTARIASDAWTDEMLLEDSFLQRSVSVQSVIDAVQMTDSLLLGSTGRGDLSSSAVMTDSAKGQLTAIQHVHEMFFAEDSILNANEDNFAWTANSDTWAMSRYDGFAYDGISVLNGKLYGWNKHGVFAAGKAAEAINAVLTTGRLDFGEQLVHPLAAFVEYSMDGADKSFNISVTTTQSGAQQTYKYLLPDERSEFMTNGRIAFGRGLRGRQFAFGCSIYAKAAELHSLSIEFTSTARRT
ncbi:hypothetical protein [Acinetobacter entericus]|uniref:Uncharacterized protein n=1 Tax=Acinetobacter entericus TaxID=2989714 RepID=A0ABT3NEH3_9GAMM|nr:hypothetical protein [Acinetobacter entericus]MCW8037954.1 hypothetical protein [Acinetobacter entericus]